LIHDVESTSGDPPDWGTGADVEDRVHRSRMTAVAMGRRDEAAVAAGR
jgi:hypothetical protein